MGTKRLLSCSLSLSKGERVPKAGEGLVHGFKSRNWVGESSPNPLPAPPSGGEREKFSGGSVYETAPLRRGSRQDHFTEKQDNETTDYGTTDYGLRDHFAEKQKTESRKGTTDHGTTWPEVLTPCFLAYSESQVLASLRDANGSSPAYRWSFPRCDPGTTHRLPSSNPHGLVLEFGHSGTGSVNPKGWQTIAGGRLGRRVNDHRKAVSHGRAPRRGWQTSET